MTQLPTVATTPEVEAMQLLGANQREQMAFGF